MTTTESAPREHASGAPSSSPLGASPRSLTRDGDDHGAHLLRLVLDLQLDALLLGLGAAAVEASRGQSPVPTSAGGVPGTPPWPRWAVEDVDLARALAAETVHSGAALPATLGPEPAAQEEQIVLQRLIARYESMHDLLGDLQVRTSRQGLGQTHLQELLAHCQNRLAELRTLARPASPARRGTHATAHEYLPGELLG
ncbi:MAG TPA: hypothetical protein VFP72_07930 [Kineosporiaceae bacterium]|nr:hypothetical protein [Kineosporiaceae bacterium]